ncbi:hypothetical protein ABBQ32_011812 [Trebouxia sp. C0010 RCD-2024]
MCQHCVHCMVVAYLLYSICCAYSVCRSIFTVPINSLGMFADVPTGMLETHQGSCSQERYSSGLGSLHAVASVPAKPSAGVLPSANSSLPLTFDIADDEDGPEQGGALEHNPMPSIPAQATRTRLAAEASLPYDSLQGSQQQRYLLDQSDRNNLGASACGTSGRLSVGLAASTEVLSTLEGGTFRAGAGYHQLLTAVARNTRADSTIDDEANAYDGDGQLSLQQQHEYEAGQKRLRDRSLGKGSNHGTERGGKGVAKTCQACSIIQNTPVQLIRAHQNSCVFCTKCVVKSKGKIHQLKMVDGVPHNCPYK